MAEDFLTIEISAESPEEWGRILEAKVTDLHGDPVPGAEVRITVEGEHGTLASGLHVTEEIGVSNRHGQVLVLWYEYPRYLPRRELKSVVRANCELADCSVKLRDILKEYGLRIEWIGT